jgi:hypothetical protein
MNRRGPSIQWRARCLPRGGGDLPWDADQANNPAAHDASAGAVAAMKGPSHVPLHGRGSIKTNLRIGHPRGATPHRRPNRAPLFRGMGNQTSEAFAYIEREYKDVKGRRTSAPRWGPVVLAPFRSKSGPF